MYKYVILALYSVEHELMVIEYFIFYFLCVFFDLQNISQNKSMFKKADYCKVNVCCDKKINKYIML